MLRPAIFLDRDGTLNVEKNYLYKPADWEWIPGAIDAIRAFNQAGYLVIVVTNQAGIARGFFSGAEVEALHQHVDQMLSAQCAKVDAYYYCPHHPDFSGPCDCRKPKPGMLLRAQSEHQIDMSRSWMIGDKVIDVQAGLAAGARSVLALTGYGVKEKVSLPQGVLSTDSVATAARHILSLS